MANIWAGSGENWDRGEMKFAHSNPSTPGVKDSLWEKGAVAFMESAGGKLFDGLVASYEPKDTGGKYGGETSEMFDKDPGGLYKARNKAYKDASSNLETEYNANQAALTEAMNKKIAEYRRNYKIPETVSDEDVARRVNRAFSEIEPAKKYFVDSETGERRVNPHFKPNIPYYQKQEDLLISQKKGLDKWHSDYLSQPNIGKKVIKRGWAPNFMYGDAKKGQVYYSDIFDDGWIF